MEFWTVHRETRLSPDGVRAAGMLSIMVLVIFGVSTDSFAAAHWSFQPLVRPVVPAFSGDSVSSANPIDAFVSAKLKDQHLGLLPEADRRTLLRRLSFDLRGLPPSPEEVAAFVMDSSANAYEKWVDRFLASPQYGERWGRQWLDVAAYADSNGYFSADSDRPLAWKYRDYVVRSLNSDKPFDRFIQEQVAGDELVGYATGDDVTPEIIDPLVATHFWRNAPDGTGESDGNSLEVKVDRYSVLEGDVQLIGSAFLGLTLQCSRCHDHKFEPVKQEEYYALEAILRPAFDPDRWLKPNERVIKIGTRSAREKNERQLREHERALKTLKESLEGLAAPFRKELLEENLAKVEEPLRKALRQALNAKEKERNDTMKALLRTNAAVVEITNDALEKRFDEFAAAARPLQEAVRRRESTAPKPLDQIAVLSEPTNAPPAHHLLIRGNHAQEGKEVGPGVPAILCSACNFTLAASAPRQDAQDVCDGANPDSHGSAPAHALRTSGCRLALARWLTAPSNPIVPRVLANRIWAYHFGRGLVATPDNLGQSGARPSDPELLDWLASQFIRSGWRLKELNRLIVSSATYRQSPAPSVAGGNLALRPVSGEHPGTQTQPIVSGPGQAAAETPWHGFPLMRLDAEAIRDAMLSVSGEIDSTVGGPYVPTKTDSAGQVIVDEQKAGAKRRSIYLQQRRTQPVNFLATFDGPAHNPVCIQRVQSTVALQSLSLLNSDFVRNRARAFAKRLLSISEAEPGGTAWEAETSRHEALLQRAFELSYGRPPTADERGAAEEFVRTQAANYPDHPDVRERVWTDFCQMLLASNQFLYVE